MPANYDAPCIVDFTVMDTRDSADEKLERKREVKVI